MIANGVVKSTCGICLLGCGILIHLKDGQVVKIEGASEAPLNKGMLCPKAYAAIEYLYHPDRLKHPLKRVGARGEGKWQQVSWDEALGIIADQMTKAKEKYGVESIVFLRGSAKGMQDGLFTRFANAVGTPNITSMSHVCYVPRINASTITFGPDMYSDFEYPTGCVVLWGSNPIETQIPVYEPLTRALKQGKKLIVVDPVRTEFVEKADCWLRLRPGTDLALAMGMANVIINEQLFSQEFVANWAFGFDELKAHVQDYSPEKVAEITWVPADQIRKAARLYACNRPGCIEAGNGIDTNINSIQAHRAILILEIITGNIGVPGGKVKWARLPVLNRSSPEFTLQNNIPSDLRERRLGAEWKLAPIAKYALPQTIQSAMLSGKPYPVHVAYIHACNPLLVWSNARQVYNALNNLDLFSVSDMFMTPTAALADVVLPVASFLEFDSVVQTGVFPPVAQVQQKVAQVGEALPDFEIISGLAHKMGMGDLFWNSNAEFNDAILKPAGLTFEEFREVGVISSPKHFRIHEKDGFDTPSKKAEIYSNLLKEWGFDPLPKYRELPETPYSEPELAKEYPLVLTSRKRVAYRHTQGRQIPSLRAMHPEPVTVIHPETAAKLGIKEGDEVYIETKRGRIKQKATLTDWIDPRVVEVAYGWWYPERKLSEDLYGWAESNINILTEDGPPYNPEMGSTTLRGFCCRIYKA